MSNILETHARITTQLALKDTASSMERFVADVDALLGKKIKGKKQSRKNAVKIFDEMLDQCFQGALIDKSIVKDTKQKTSKHNAHTWMYLRYDSERPFTRKSEHLIEVWYTEMKSKKPDAFRDLPLGVYVTRHLLERAALRKKASCIEDMVDFLNPHVMLMAKSMELRKRAFEESGLVLVTRNEYVIIGALDEFKVILKTTIPRHEWSGTKANRLAPVMEMLDKKKQSKWCDVAVVDINRFNTVKELHQDDFLVFNFEHDPLETGDQDSGR